MRVQNSPLRVQTIGETAWSYENLFYFFVGNSKYIYLFRGTILPFDYVRPTLLVSLNHYTFNQLNLYTHEKQSSYLI